MFCNLSDFANAYQEELLRSTRNNPVDPKKLLKIEATHHEVDFSEILLSRFGDLLIYLGKRIKGQTPCPELTHGQA